MHLQVGVVILQKLDWHGFWENIKGIKLDLIVVWIQDLEAI